MILLLGTGYMISGVSIAVFVAIGYHLYEKGEI